MLRFTGKLLRENNDFGLDIVHLKNLLDIPMIKT